MNEPRPPGAHPPHPPHAPHAPAVHPQAPQIHGTAHQPPRPVLTPTAPGSGASARPGIAPMPTMRPHDDELDPIELVEEDLQPAPVPGAGPRTGPQQMAPPTPKKIIAFGADGHRTQHAWKRTPICSGQGACRVRSFHGKYSEQGLEYLDNAINDWLDGHPEIEVKFVTSTVMTFEGKIREPALVLNVWY